MYTYFTLYILQVEWSGDGIVALNSKTYYCFGSDNPKEDEKFSAKGISRKVNDIDAQQYKDVLQHKRPQSFVNRGFIQPHKCPDIHTYEMQRCGLTWFYGKRKVLPDGVSTVPLDL